MHIYISVCCYRQGQLGHGTIENQSTPRVVEALEAIQMSAIAAGGWHSIAVSGTVKKF